MKLLHVHLVMAMLGIARAWEVHRIFPRHHQEEAGTTPHRGLEQQPEAPEFGFFVLGKHDAESIVTNADGSSNGAPETQSLLLCLTAPSNTMFSLKALDPNLLFLMPCDFQKAPPGQLWKLENGFLFSDIGNGNTRCMEVATAPTNAMVREGMRMRLAKDCSDLTRTRHRQFAYNGGVIHVGASDTDFCLTHRGINANVGDTIHAKTCNGSGTTRFQWTYSMEDPRNDQDDTTLYAFFANGGCMQPKDGSTAKFTEIFLDECDENRAWNVVNMDGGGGVVVFRAGMDTNMCMQAGGSIGSVGHGSKLRLLPCKKNEPLQQFQWSDEEPIQLASRKDLCVEWRGQSANVGTDPMVMKICDGTQYGWSSDVLDE